MSMAAESWQPGATPVEIQEESAMTPKYRSTTESLKLNTVLQLSMDGSHPCSGLMQLSRDDSHPSSGLTLVSSDGSHPHSGLLQSSVDGGHPCSGLVQLM